MKQEPRIVKSELTGQWYIVTRYRIRKHKDATKAWLEALTKYEVTEQMKAILAKETR
jgi:hypothetical protein